MSERFITFQKVFETFNKNYNGKKFMNEVKQKYISKYISAIYSDVVNWKKTKMKCMKNFYISLKYLENYNDNLRACTTMNFNKFEMLYDEIDMNIKDDNLFDYLIIFGI